LGRQEVVSEVDEKICNDQFRVGSLAGIGRKSIKSSGQYISK